MNADKASVIVRLSFSGLDLDPDRLSEQLRCLPTESYRKGDMRGPNMRVATECKWVLESHRTEPADAQIASLFKGATDDFSVWRELVARYQGLLEFVVRAPTLNDALFLSPDIVRALADRGLEISIDIWNEHADRHRPA